MYNRYIPQADGSYFRQKVPDRAQKHKPCAASPAPPDKPNPCPAPPCREPKKQKPEIPATGGFLQKLFPGGFDTEDLIIILLLLLIAGDCREDQNFALLTLGLYLFM